MGKPKALPFNPSDIPDGFVFRITPKKWHDGEYHTLYVQEGEEQHHIGTLKYDAQKRMFVMSDIFLMEGSFHGETVREALVNFLEARKQRAVARINAWIFKAKGGQGAPR